MKQTPNSSTADKLIKKAEEQAKRNNLSKSEYLDLKRACRAVFATRNGRKLGYAWMKMSGIYSYPKNNSNPIVMGETNGRAELYAFFVLNMVSHEQRMEIEKGEL